MSDWGVLKDKEIISIIIGDEYIKNEFIFNEVRMPYMKKKDIYNFGETLGMNKNLLDEQASRNACMEKVLDFAINKNKINAFFKSIFDLKRFREICDNDFWNPQGTYYDIINNVMVRINQILFYDKCRIEYNLENYVFSLVDNENEIVLSSEVIEKVDNQYIKKIQEQALEVIKTGDYDSAITKSRTMLEEVFIYGIEEKELKAEAKGNIIKLYNQFKNNYNLNTSSELDNRVNDLISGFNKIVDSIARMRDLNSDSHGAGARRIAIDHNVAVLYVNSAITLTNFFLSLVEKNKM